MRQKEKTVLLLLAVVAIGMFALPSTLAMYTGQHNFTNGSNVDCDKCHGTNDDIYAELIGGDAHQTFSCKDCHGYSTNLGGSPNTNNSTGHAATLGVMCLDCHADENAAASALNITAAYNMDNNSMTIVDEFNQDTAAHKDLYDYYNTTGIGNLDEMCIACHTKSAVNISTSAINVNYTANPVFNLSRFTYGEDDY